MTALDERTAIHQLFSDSWQEVGVPITDIATENTSYDPVEGREYVRVAIRAADAFRLTIGSTKSDYRYPSVLFVQVFTPLGTGDGRAIQLAEQAAAIFRANTLAIPGGRIIFRTPTVRRVGPDKTFYQVNCVVPFVRDQLS